MDNLQWRIVWEFAVSQLRALGFGLVVLQRWLWRLLCRVWGFVAPAMKITVLGFKFHSAEEGCCSGLEMSQHGLRSYLCRVWGFVALTVNITVLGLRFHTTDWILLCWFWSFTALRKASVLGYKCHSMDWEVTCAGFEVSYRWLNITVLDLKFHSAEEGFCAGI
jgi:hypothetical protein